MKEQIKKDLKNMCSMILIIENDLMNVEGSVTEDITCEALELLRDYISTVSNKIECI